MDPAKHDLGVAHIAPLYRQYVSDVNGQGEPDATNFSDMLADMMHFAVARQVSFDGALLDARRNFEAEFDTERALGDIGAALNQRLNLLGDSVKSLKVESDPS
jgi:hypothetical protein